MWRTGTGNFCQRKTKADREVYANLGLGISIYFKQIKSLSWFFLFCSIVSLPQLLILYFSGEHELTLDDPKLYFSTFTLGNLG